MKIKKIECNNFQSYEKCSLELKNVDIVGIIGQYENNLEKSNGSGKSTIFDMILYAVYGRGRTQSIDELIRIGQDEMKVFLEFEINNKIISVERGRIKKSTYVSLKINGDEFSENVKETDDKIVKILGMDFDLFIATVFFQQHNSDNFTSASPSVRKEYLKNILKLDFYDLCYDKVKDTISLLENELSQIDSKIEYISGLITSSNSNEINKSLDDSSNKLEKVKIEIKDLEQSIKENKIIEDKRKSINDLLISLDEEIKRKNNELKEYSSLIKSNSNYLQSLKLNKVNEGDFNSIMNELNEAKESKYSIQSNNSFIENKMEELKNRKLLIVGKQKCPVCNSKITDELYNEIISDMKKEYEKLKSNLNSNKNKLIEINDSIQKLELKCKEAKERIEENNTINLKKSKAESNIENYTNNINRINKEVDDHALKFNLKKEELSKIKKIDVNIFELENDLKKKIEQKENLIYKISEVKQKIKEIEDKKTELNKLKNESSKVRENYAIYTILKNIFSKNGIISNVIKNSVSEIEEESNNILSDIDNNEKKITFETTRETSSKNLKDTLDIMIETNEGIRRYESFSGGEQSIINFAIRMSLAMILSKRENIWNNVIVLDEVFAALDRFHRNKMSIVINYLKKMFSQIFVISHTDVQDLFPHLIRVVKNEKTNISRIEEVK